MTDVVLMAGGLGLRLHPLTLHVPKPMLTVGSKPILEKIVEKFIAQDFRRFVFCVNYKRELIEGYFGNGQRWGAEISYVRETEPLGTAGALRLMPLPSGPFIVSNADVLTDLSYAKLMKHHVRSGADATVCRALHQYQVPYGVAEADVYGQLVGIQEKPVVSWPVAAGIYVLNPEALGLAVEGRLDMPDLISRLGTVSTFDISEHWLDVGTIACLERANGAV